MRAAVCPHDRTALRELESTTAFVRHAGCTTCKRVYVVWDDTLSLCGSPMQHVGETWRFFEASAPPKHGAELPPRKQRHA